MTILESPTDTPLDELAQLQLRIAQRADQLTREFSADHSARDFWSEAESEVWSAELKSMEPTRAA